MARLIFHCQFCHKYLARMGNWFRVVLSKYMHVSDEHSLIAPAMWP